MPPLPPAPHSPRALAARLSWGVAHGPTLDPLTASLLADGLGGVVLFERNVESVEQVRRLVADLRAAARGHLLVAVDQEGGHIIRLGEPLTRFPGAMALGAVGSPRLAFEVARASARELRAVGIDVVLAPVLDVAVEASNPVLGARSLGDDPAAVATLGAAMIRGYRAGGVLPVAKHFPGHGRTALDSHRVAPVVGGGPGALAAVDLPPFAAAVRAGVPALMVGHVAYAGLGRARPASLEPAAYRLARRTLGFSGATVTDALVMDAITARGSVPDAAVEAVAAGADIVMALDLGPAAIDALAQAIESGRLPMPRAAQAERRAGALARSAPAATPAVRPGSRAPSADRVAARHAELALEVAAASLTLVDDAAALLPLDPATSICLVECASGRPSPIEDGTAEGTRLAESLVPRFPRLAVHWLGSMDDRAALAAALAAAARAEVVILATRDAAALAGGPVLGGAADRSGAAALGGTAAQLLGASLAALGRPVIHVALRGPADLAGSPAPARIATYADVPASLDALAAALLVGPAAFPGRLPVSLERQSIERAAGGEPSGGAEAAA